MGETPIISLTYTLTQLMEPLILAANAEGLEPNDEAIGPDASYQIPERRTSETKTTRLPSQNHLI